MRLSNEAFKAVPTTGFDVKPLTILQKLQGVGPVEASAILSLVCPLCYPFMGIEALQATGEVCAILSVPPP